MKKIIFIMLLMGAVSKADTNIVSVLVGDGPTGIQTYGSPASSSSSTTTQGNNGQGNGAGNGNHSTTTTTSSGGNQNYLPERGLVAGLQYQHRVSGGPLWLGVLVQSNHTTSVSFGIGF